MASYHRSYDDDEIDRALKEAKEIRAAPLADRKEAQAAFFEAMRDEPRRIGEQVSWLFNGSYGKGAQLLAQRILHSPRMNRVAALTQMVGLYNWRCPEVMTVQAWKRLSGGEKHELARAVEHEIERAERDDED